MKSCNVKEGRIQLVRLVTGETLEGVPSSRRWVVFWEIFIFDCYTPARPSVKIVDFVLIFTRLIIIYAKGDKGWVRGRGWTANPRRPSSVCMLEANPESSRTCVIPVNPSGVEINLKHRALLFNQREPCLTKKYCVQAKGVFFREIALFTLLT